MATDLLLPEPRVADPREAPPLRWGVLAPGFIAGRWVDAVRSHTSQRVVAAGSRSLERAQDFAGTHGIDRAYGSYEQLVQDPDVDVVYVASPHSHHHEQVLLAIAAGKHVLVEKAFTRNATEARELVDAARAAGVLLMEAMWTRYLPHTDVIRQLLEHGALGDVHRVTADFAVRTEPDPTHRLLDPALAGGVLLDLGVYPLAFASFAASGARPTSVQATGVLASTGVDAQVSALVGYGPHLQASVFTSMLAATPDTAEIAGSVARVEVGEEFYLPTTVTLVREGRRATWDDNRIHGHDGLCFQAAALAGYVADGRTESPWQPLDETVAILETADEIRRQLGVVYPGEVPTAPAS